MAFEKNVYDMKFLFLVLIGIPLIASTNIDCSGKSFHCLNSTHFMICADFGGFSYTVDDFVIPCPPPTVCLRTNRYECEFAATTTFKPTTTLQSSVTVEKETTTEELIVDTLPWSTGPEQHIELSTVVTQETTTDASVIPLSTQTSGYETVLNGIESTTLITTEPSGIITVSDQAFINVVNKSASVSSMDVILTKTDNFLDNFTTFVDFGSVATDDFITNDNVTILSDTVDEHETKKINELFSSTDNAIKFVKEVNTTESTAMNNSDVITYAKEEDNIFVTNNVSLTNAPIIIMQETRASSLSERSVSTTEASVELSVTTGNLNNYDSTTEFTSTVVAVAENGTDEMYPIISENASTLVSNVVSTTEGATISKLNEAFVQDTVTDIILTNTPYVNIEATTTPTDITTNTAVVLGVTEALLSTVEFGNFSKTQGTESILLTTESTLDITSKLNYPTEEIVSHLGTTESNSLNFEIINERNVVNNTANQYMESNSGISVKTTATSTVDNYKEEQNTAVDVGTTPATVSIDLNKATRNSQQTAAEHLSITTIITSNKTVSENREITTESISYVLTTLNVTDIDKGLNETDVGTVDFVSPTTATITTDYISPMLINTEKTYDDTSTTLHNDDNLNAMKINNITTESLRTTIDTTTTTKQASDLSANTAILLQYNITTEKQGPVTTTPITLEAILNNLTASQDIKQSTTETLHTMLIIEKNTEETVLLNGTESAGSFNKSEPIVLINHILPLAVAHLTNATNTTLADKTGLMKSQTYSVQSQSGPAELQAYTKVSTTVALSELQANTKQINAGPSKSLTNSEVITANELPVNTTPAKPHRNIELNTNGSTESRVNTVLSIVAPGESPANTEQSIATPAESSTESQVNTVQRIVAAAESPAKTQQSIAIPAESQGNTDQTAAPTKYASSTQQVILTELQANTVRGTDAPAQSLTTTEHSTTRLNRSQSDNEQNFAVVTESQANYEQSITGLAEPQSGIENITTALTEPQTNTLQIAVDEAHTEHIIAGLIESQANIKQSTAAVTEPQGNTEQVTSAQDNIVQSTAAPAALPANTERSNAGLTESQANVEKITYAVTKSQGSTFQIPAAQAKQSNVGLTGPEANLEQSTVGLTGLQANITQITAAQDNTVQSNAGLFASQNYFEISTTGPTAAQRVSELSISTTYQQGLAEQTLQRVNETTGSQNTSQKSIAEPTVLQFTSQQNIVGLSTQQSVSEHDPVDLPGSLTIMQQGIAATTDLQDSSQKGIVESTVSQFTYQQHNIVGLSAPQSVSEQDTANLTGSQQGIAERTDSQATSEQAIAGTTGSQATSQQNIAGTTGSQATSVQGTSNLKSGSQTTSQQRIAETTSSQPTSQKGIAYQTGSLATLQQSIAESTGSQATSQQGIVELSTPQAVHKQDIDDFNHSQANLQQGIVESVGSQVTSQEDFAESTGSQATSQQGIAESTDSQATSQQGSYDPNGSQASLQQSVAESTDSQATSQQGIVELTTPQAVLKQDIVDFTNSQTTLQQGIAESTGSQNTSQQSIGESIVSIVSQVTLQQSIAESTGSQTTSQQDFAESTSSQATPQQGISESTDSQATSQQGSYEPNGSQTSLQQNIAESTDSQATSQQGIFEMTTPQDVYEQDIVALTNSQTTLQQGIAESTGSQNTSQQSIGESIVSLQRGTYDLTGSQAESQQGFAESTSSQAHVQQGVSDLTGSQATLQPDITDLTGSKATLQQSIAESTGSQASSQQGIAESTGSQDTLQQDTSDLTASQATVKQSVIRLSTSQAVSEQDIDDITGSPTAWQQGLAGTTDSQDTSQQGITRPILSQAALQQQLTSELTALQTTLQYSIAGTMGSQAILQQGTYDLIGSQGVADNTGSQDTSHSGIANLTSSHATSQLGIAETTSSQATSQKGIAEITGLQATSQQEIAKSTGVQATLQQGITERGPQDVLQQGIAKIGFNQNISEPQTGSEQKIYETTRTQSNSIQSTYGNTRPRIVNFIQRIAGLSDAKPGRVAIEFSHTGQTGLQVETTQSVTQPSRLKVVFIEPTEQQTNSEPNNVTLIGNSVSGQVEPPASNEQSTIASSNSTENTVSQVKVAQINTIVNVTQFSGSKEVGSQTNAGQNNTNILQSGITQSDKNKPTKLLKNSITEKIGATTNAEKNIAMNTVQNEQNISLTNISSRVIHVRNGTVTVSQNNLDQKSVLNGNQFSSYIINSQDANDGPVSKTIFSLRNKMPKNAAISKNLNTKLTSANPEDNKTNLIKDISRDSGSNNKFNSDSEITAVSGLTLQDNVSMVTLLDSAYTVTTIIISEKRENDIFPSIDVPSPNANTASVTDALLYDNKEYNIVSATTPSNIMKLSDDNQQNSQVTEENKVSPDQFQNGEATTTTPLPNDNGRSLDIISTWYLAVPQTTTMPSDLEVSTISTTTTSTDKVETTTSYNSTTKSLTSSSATDNKLSESQFDCQGRSSGRYADNDDCSKFYICSGTVQTIIGSCPVNTVFSDIKKQCTRNLSHCIRNNEFKCTLPGRFADYLKPSDYYICMPKDQSFLRYKLQCQKGYLLNRLTVTCYKNTQPSSQSTSNDNSQSTSDRVLSQEKEVKKTSKDKKTIVFECEEEGKFADPNNCRGYYVCKLKNKSEETYRRKHKKCDEDEVFHKERKKCVDASSSYESAIFRYLYSDILIPNIYYVRIKRGNHFITYKLQCQNDYYLNMKTVICERKDESSSQSESQDISKSTSEDVSKKNKISERNKNRNFFECQEEGKFADPNDCRRYYLCKEKRNSRVHERKFRRKQKKCGGHEVFSEVKQRCLYSRNKRCI